MIIFWEYTSVEDIEEKIEEYLLSVLNSSMLVTSADLKKSFFHAYDLFHKALKNEIPGCRVITLKGWHIIAFNNLTSDIILLSYFDPKIIGFEEFREKDFIEKLTKISPTSIPMFMGIENSMDIEIDKIFKNAEFFKE